MADTALAPPIKEGGLPMDGAPKAALGFEAAYDAYGPMVYRLAVRPYEEEHWGDAFTGYHIYGRPIAHALEEFTQEFQDDFAAWDHPSILFNQKFDTWEQAKAYLGDSIPLVWHSMDGVIFTNEYRVSAKYEMYGDGKIT